MEADGEISLPVHPFWLFKIIRIKTVLAMEGHDLHMKRDESILDMTRFVRQIKTMTATETTIEIEMHDPSATIIPWTKEPCSMHSEMARRSFQFYKGRVTIAVVDGYKPAIHPDHEFNRFPVSQPPGTSDNSALPELTIQCLD